MYYVVRSWVQWSRADSDTGILRRSAVDKFHRSDKCRVYRRETVRHHTRWCSYSTQPLSSGEQETRRYSAATHTASRYATAHTPMSATTRGWRINPLTPTVAIWVQLRSILCQTGLSRSFVICDFWALWRSGLSVRVPGCQKLQMTGLTLSGRGCFIAVPIWQQWASKG